MKIEVIGTPAHQADIIGLMNQLCPSAGGFSIVNGRVTASNPAFFEDQYVPVGNVPCLFHSGPLLKRVPGPYGSSNTPKSCACINTAFKDTFTTYRIYPFTSTVGPVWNRRTHIRPGGRTDRNGPGVIDIEIGSESPPYTGTGDPDFEGRVRAPRFISFGHEFCGHAVPGDSSEDGPIDVENDLRIEHGVPGDRDGEDHKKGIHGTW